MPVENILEREIIQNAYINPFWPNGIPHCYQFDELLGGILHFYSNFNITFCKQTVETLIRRRRTSDAAFCGVWSGSVLFAYVPQKGR